MSTRIKDIVDLANKYETSDFIKGDPIQFPHRYTKKEDIEISAFVTSWIAWGNRKQIIQKADFIDREIFQGKPYKYIMSGKWAEYMYIDKKIYRTFSYRDFYRLCSTLYHIYSCWNNMEDAIRYYIYDISDILLIISSFFASVNGIPNNDSNSACKRLCLFLRWMCRKDSPVDFGIWDICDSSELIIPLDTHVLKQSRNLGLTKRKTSDMKTAIEITNRLKMFFLGDPVKGDFALFGLGINKI